MNLWLRLIGFFICVWSRPKLNSLVGKSALSFRVWPSDLDLSFHMNNGRYLTLMDLGRLDFMVRTGLAREVLRYGWMPVVSTGLVRYRRELRCFQPFVLETLIIDWDETHVLFEHRFIFSKGERAGDVAAYCLIRAGLYDKTAGAFVPVERLIDLVGLQPESGGEAIAKPDYPEARQFKDAEGMLYETPRAKHADDKSL